MEIYPKSGAGLIQFGMTINEIRAILGSNPATFRKGDAELETDAFENHSIHVYYRYPGVCEAIEFFPPALVTLQSKNLIGRPFSEVLRWISSIDPTVEVHRAGLKSMQLGVALFAPALKAPHEPVESVLVFDENHFQ